jgi:hypothetical protein
MKSPGVIYRKYRQRKRKLLYEMVVQARQVSHENCHYGQTVEHMDFSESGCRAQFKICAFGFDPASRKIEFCTCPKECNAFVNKWTKEKVEESFEKSLLDWGTKVKLYPDLVALEWVLDKELTDAIKEPNFMGKVIIATILFLEHVLKYVNPVKKTVVDEE